MKYLLPIFALVAVLAFPSVSFAALDVAAEVTTLKSDGTSTLTSVGGALVSLAVIAVLFKWAKAAFFS